MKRNRFRVPAAILYLFFVICIVFYGWLSFAANFVLSPAGRLILLLPACLALYFGSLLMAKTVNDKRAKLIMKITFGAVFAAYVMLVITFTLFDFYFGRLSAFSPLSGTRFTLQNYQTYLRHSMNLIPFETVINSISSFLSGRAGIRVLMTNIVGNIVAFMPFALFLPLLFEKFKSLKAFLIAMLCIVGTVEILQLVLMTGSFDFDDLLLNVGGAWLCYWFLHLKVPQKVIETITTMKY